MRKYDIDPISGQKSFYGKAHGRTERGANILRSYDTDVCRIDAAGRFYRMWDGYSATTLKHVNAFRALFGLEPLKKSDWQALPVVPWSIADAVGGLLVEYERLTA